MTVLTGTEIWYTAVALCVPGIDTPGLALADEGEADEGEADEGVAEPDVLHPARSSAISVTASVRTQAPGRRPRPMAAQYPGTGEITPRSGRPGT
jgi:hypothetical protein